MDIICLQRLDGALDLFVVGQFCNSRLGTKMGSAAMIFLPFFTCDFVLYQHFTKRMQSGDFILPERDSCFFAERLSPFRDYEVDFMFSRAIEYYRARLPGRFRLCILLSVRE